MVIVIAVIAILAAVLIPTFGNVIEKANNSALLQEAKNAYTEYLALDLSDGIIDGKDNDGWVVPDGHTWTPNADKSAVAEFKYVSEKGTATFDGSEWTVVLGGAAEETPTQPVVCTTFEASDEDATKCKTCGKTEAEH